MLALLLHQDRTAMSLEKRHASLPALLLQVCGHTTCCMLVVEKRKYHVLHAIHILFIEYVLHMFVYNMYYICINYTTSY